MATAEPIRPAVMDDAEGEERRERTRARYLDGTAASEAWTGEDFATRRDEIIKRG